MKEEVRINIAPTDQGKLDDISNFVRSRFYDVIYPEEIGMIETGKYIFRFYPHCNVSHEKRET